MSSTSRRILVTGGAGFIGCNFVGFLLDRRPEWHIVNYDALTYAVNPTTSLTSSMTTGTRSCMRTSAIAASKTRREFGWEPVGSAWPEALAKTCPRATKIS